MLHVAGDLVQSMGVALAGALIWWKQACPAYMSFAAASLQAHGTDALHHVSMPYSALWRSAMCVGVRSFSGRCTCMW